MIGSLLLVALSATGQAASSCDGAFKRIGERPPIDPALKDFVDQFKWLQSPSRVSVDQDGRPVVSLNGFPKDGRLRSLRLNKAQDSFTIRLEGVPWKDGVAAQEFLQMAKANEVDGLPQMTVGTDRVAYISFSFRGPTITPVAMRLTNRLMAWILSQRP